MKTKEIKKFLEDFDLGWHDECYTIAKVTVEKVIKDEKEEE